MYEVNKSWEKPSGSNAYILGGFLDIWRKEIIFGRSGKLNEQVIEFAEETASEFAANVISARRNETVQLMLSDWTNVQPVTMQEFEEAIARSVGGKTD